MQIERTGISAISRMGETHLASVFSFCSPAAPVPCPLPPVLHLRADEWHDPPWAARLFLSLIIDFVNCALAHLTTTTSHTCLNPLKCHQNSWSGGHFCSTDFVCSRSLLFACADLIPKLFSTQKPLLRSEHLCTGC